MEGVKWLKCLTMAFIIFLTIISSYHICYALCSHSLSHLGIFSYSETVAFLVYCCLLSTLKTLNECKLQWTMESAKTNFYDNTLSVLS